MVNVIRICAHITRHFVMGMIDTYSLLKYSSFMHGVNRNAKAKGV